MGRGEESGAGFGVPRCWWKEEIPAGIAYHRGDTEGTLTACPARGDGADPTRSRAHGSQHHPCSRQGGCSAPGPRQPPLGTGQREADPGTGAPQLGPPPDDPPLPKEGISGLKSHLDPSPCSLPQPRYPPPEGAEGPSQHRHCGGAAGSPRTACTRQPRVIKSSLPVNKCLAED